MYIQVESIFYWTKNSWLLLQWPLCQLGAAQSVQAGQAMATPGILLKPVEKRKDISGIIWLPQAPKLIKKTIKPSHQRKQPHNVKHAQIKALIVGKFIPQDMTSLFLGFLFCGLHLLLNVIVLTCKKMHHYINRKQRQVSCDYILPKSVWVRFGFFMTDRQWRNWVFRDKVQNLRIFHQLLNLKHSETGGKTAGQGRVSWVWSDMSWKGNLCFRLWKDKKWKEWFIMLHRLEAW